MDNFLRRLLIHMMSTPKPLDPTAPRIANIPQGGVPFGATNQVPPPTVVPRMSAAAPQSGIAPSPWMPPKPASMSSAGLGNALPPPAYSASKVGSMSPAMSGTALPQGGFQPTVSAGRPLTPSVTTSEEFRAAPSTSVPPVAKVSPARSAPHPVPSPATHDEEAFIPSEIASPMIDPTMLNIAGGELQDQPEEDIVPQDLESRGLSQGMTILPNNNPTGAMEFGRPSQGSPDLVSIIRKALGKLR